MANNSPLSCLRRRLKDNRVDQKVAFCRMVVNQPVSGASRQNTFVYLSRSITQSVNASLIFGAIGISLGLFHLTLGTPGQHFVEICIMPSSFFARTPTLSPASSRSSSTIASSPPSLPSKYILPTPRMRRNLSYGSCSSLTDMDMDGEETLKLPPIQGLGRSTQRHKRLRSISAASSGFHAVDRKPLDLTSSDTANPTTAAYMHIYSTTIQQRICLLSPAITRHLRRGGAVNVRGPGGQLIGRLHGCPYSRV